MKVVLVSTTGVFHKCRECGKPGDCTNCRRCLEHCMKNTGCMRAERFQYGRNFEVKDDK